MVLLLMSHARATWPQPLIAVKSIFSCARPGLVTTAGRCVAVICCSANSSGFLEARMATWRDQVALVTGGGRGIGRAIARRLAREGASVCVNYLARADAAESLVADINANGGRAIAVAAD